MIGVLSDAHGNRFAFDKAIDLLYRYGATRIFYLGDSIGYIPTHDVVSSIMLLGEKILCVRGNHEEMLIRDEYDSSYEPIYQIAKVRQKIDQRSLDFIQGWPLRIDLDIGIGKVTFVHGSITDPINGYVYPDTNLSIFAVNSTIVFMGHTHRPFIKVQKDTTFVNVGSCGLPRDHGGLGAASLVNEESGEVKILRFNISEETAKTLHNEITIHPSVKSILSRRSNNFWGEVIGL